LILACLYSCAAPPSDPSWGAPVRTCSRAGVCGLGSAADELALLLSDG
jgi:hypothetical protein